MNLFDNPNWALIENLLLVAKSQHEKGNEFPLLLKLDPVRAGIKILKKIGADLKDLQNQMEKVYEMCEGCLQEKYGKKQKRLPQGRISDKVVCILHSESKLYQSVDL